MKRWIAWMLCMMMALALVPAALAEEDQNPGEAAAREAVFSEEIPDETAAGQTPVSGTKAGKAVTDYSYEVYPILAPFTYYIYVKTDNPDPVSFRLVDRESRFFGPEDKGEIEQWFEDSHVYMTEECEPGTFYCSTKTFFDVAYEDEGSKRVPGGYIFESCKAYSDGGELVLQRITERKERLKDCVYADTDVTISCPPLTTCIDYLIDTYTDPSKPLFENLDAVQQAMDEICVYPQAMCDSNDPNEERPYPYLGSSIYPELPLLSGCSRYHTSTEKRLIDEVYPFIKNSFSFPCALMAIAKRLEPDAEIEWNSAYHWLINVTFGGETRSYGGASTGNGNSVESRRVKKSFTFNGDRDDLAVRGTIPEYYDLLMQYQTTATEDLAYWYDMVDGETFRETICNAGGTWIRIFAYEDEQEYGYVFPASCYVETASGAWVDGRYIDDHEHFVFGERFEDHPTADIILHNVSYTDKGGNPHCQDVLFIYNQETDTWHISCLFLSAEELVLTREEAEEAVRAMDIPANGNRIPERGLIYDGKSYPGTPFTNVLAEGVVLPETFEVILGDFPVFLPVEMVPEDASYPVMTWETTDPAVARCEYSSEYHKNIVAGRKIGTATLTGTTLDGGYTATCVVTVVPNVAFPEQPQSQTVYENEEVSFRVKAEPRLDGAGPLTYIWQYSRDGENWYNTYQNGYNTDTLTFTAGANDNGLRVRCCVQDRHGFTSLSDEATLTVRHREIGSIEFLPGEVEYKGDTPYVVWNGGDMTPEVIVKDADGTVLDPSQYQVTYQDNGKPGTAYVDVTIKSNGVTASRMFKIFLPPTETTYVENTDNGIRITWKSVEGAKGYVIYRRAWNLTSAGWTEFKRWNNTTETSWTDTKVYAGTRYQYGIKAYFSDPMDNYNLGIVGPLKTTVRITSRTLLGVDAGKKQMTVRWSGSMYFTGYQIRYSTDPNFRDGVVAFKIARPDVYRNTIKGLRSGRTYYVQIRSYHEFEGMTYFGAWSAPTACKVK